MSLNFKILTLLHFFIPKVLTCNLLSVCKCDGVDLVWIGCGFCWWGDTPVLFYHLLDRVCSWVQVWKFVVSEIITHNRISIAFIILFLSLFIIIFFPLCLFTTVGEDHSCLLDMYLPSTQVLFCYILDSVTVCIFVHISTYFPGSCRKWCYYGEWFCFF